MKVSCTQHKKSCEFVCFKCNVMMCSICILKHNINHQDHARHCDHIHRIRQSLNDNLINQFNNNSVDTENNDEDDVSPLFKETISSIWNVLKSSTERYKTLSTTENEISKHFEELHTYLINEEHKLKKPITNQKDTIVDQIDNNINSLKHLINIIHINNKLENIQVTNIENNSINDIKSPESSDTTAQYSTATMIESISSSSTLKSFIDDNSKTVFSPDINNNYFNIRELLPQHNNDTDSLLLDIVHKYNNQLTNTDNNNNNNSNSNIDNKFTLSTNTIDFKQIDSIISNSINLSIVSPTILTIASPLTNINKDDDNKIPYILTSHYQGVTLINTTNNQIEQLAFNFDFIGVYSAMITIGEFVYIFCDINKNCNIITYSIKSKSIQYIGEIDVVSNHFKSICYDGQDYIYLVNGDLNNRIDRINIFTLQFESYYNLTSKKYSQQLSSLIFNGKLYSVSSYYGLIIEFDIKNKIVHENNIDIKPYSACHDNNGNFYIHSDTNRFIKYNVETKQITHIKPIPVKKSLVWLVYQRESPTESYIYSFGGSSYGNFRYSIEDNQSEPFFKGDNNYNRILCGSASFSL